jgi:hypothetical protein
MNKTVMGTGIGATLLLIGFMAGLVSFPLAIIGIAVLGLFTIRKGLTV